MFSFCIICFSGTGTLNNLLKYIRYSISSKSGARHKIWQMQDTDTAHALGTDRAIRHVLFTPSLVRQIQVAQHLNGMRYG